MRKFTVVMLYPDYIAGTYGEETFLAHVEEDNLQRAIKSAQQEASEANDNATPDDFAVIFACFEHVEDLH